MRINFLAALLCSSAGILGIAGTCTAEAPKLTKTEQLSGWTMLFDGQSTNGWRNYKQDSVSDGWTIKDGALIKAKKGAGDIITDEQYEYFELSLEYKISKGGNSGIMFHVVEGDGPPWRTGPEIQVQDNVDGHDPQKAGWLYQLAKPPMVGKPGEQKILDATRPAGEWNEIFVRIAPDNCLVTMNGLKYYNFKLGDKRWERAVANSKFAKFDGFGAAGKGHICLQDHGDEVAYRNIKVRKLAKDGSVPQPIDGKLGVTSELAFPKMTWEGWEGMTEDGKIRPLRILEITYAAGQPETLYAISQTGEIYSFGNHQQPQEAKMILDLSGQVNMWYGRGGNEQGLLGLAMHPKFVENNQFFVYYTRATDNATVISRFTMNSDGLADAKSEEILLEVAQPFQNHNGGSIEFGNDGYLYASLGDGGFRNDPVSSGQDLGQLLGSIIRIDVDSKTEGRNYGIPADNPFVELAGAKPEIYAYGLRNPWRIAFDRKTGRLWTGDVGQELWEEVNVIEKGGNYGWSRREGTHAFGNGSSASKMVSTSAATIEPVWEYDHGVGKSITGGRVYNASRVPELTGKYIYADYVSGSVWALTYDAATGTATRNDQLLENGVPVLAFGQDAAGEVFYTIANAKGACIYRFSK